MDVIIFIFCFFGGAFITNAVPHFVHGTSGKKFQSPFAKPPGVGLSSPLVNTVWGLFNLGIGLFLSFYMGNPFTNLTSILVFSAGCVITAIGLSWYFGKINSDQT
tara:strand:+ start:83 stop:397 length:315 start_codon:yes stop_codon:yes gene_type:complete